MAATEAPQTNIHPTAIIEPGAQIGKGSTICAYAYIGKDVLMGENCVVEHHATVSGRTRMGSGNHVFPYAFIGAKTHDLKYDGGSPGLRIGDNNVFREYVSVHCATDGEDDTLLGDNNILLAYSHVAHDCIIGNHLVMSSHSALGGHVVVEDYVNVGWGVGVHQFCKIGINAMVGACSKLVQDLPPFMIADGNPAIVRTINRVGLERRGYTFEDTEVVRYAYKVLYRQKLNRSQAMEKLLNSVHKDHWVVKALDGFIEKSDRGLA